MGTLGSYLRTAREARSMDLREVAQQTRISLNFLKAIEEEDFSKLPGEVFVKGFLKSYAKFLRLPEDEVMKRYAEIGAPQPAASSAAPAVPRPPKAHRDEPRKITPAEAHPAAPMEEHSGRIGLEPFLWGGAVIIGLAVFILTALPGKHTTGGHGPTVASRGAETAGIVAALTTSVQPEKLYLDIYALEDMWVLVRTDASPQKKAALKKGESVTWSADDRFLLSYASIGAAKLVLNGKELTVNGPKSAVVRDLIVTASGIALQKMETEQPKPRRPKPVSQPTATDKPQPKPQQPEQQSATPSVTTPTPTPASAPAPAPKPKPVDPSYMPPSE
jgi:transcriptional regulator with XRE-family HTH domain